jgi:protoporphyrinogen oxidase
LPLLRAKLGANAERASAAFIWAIIARMYGARNTPAKRERFGYVRGGYATLLARLETDLQARGIRRRQGARVTRVDSGADGVSLHFESGDSLAFDAVVLTIPCAHVARLCPQLTDAERARLHGVTYQGIICVSLLLKRPLAGYYVTNITDTWVPFTGIVEMTALVDREFFGGHSLVYLPRYVTQDDPMWRQDDASIIEEFTTALERMYPGFGRGDITAGHVSRVRELLAVSTLGYSEKLAPSVRTTIPNVYVVNSAQILNGTLNVNETLGLAEEKLPELQRYLRATTAAGQTQRGLA